MNAATENALAKLDLDAEPQTSWFRQLNQLLLRLLLVVGGYVLLAGIVFVFEWIGAQRGQQGLGIVGLGVDLVLLSLAIAVAGRYRWSLVSSLGPVLALLGVVFFFAVADWWFQDLAGHFWSLRNLRTVAVQTSTIAVAALGMTIIIISGGIDLSAGTMLALCATVLAYCLDAGYSVGAAILASMLIGGTAGLSNGTLVSGLRVVPFIITLGTMTAFQGIAKIIAKETTVRPSLDRVPEWLPSMVSPVPGREWIAWPLLPNFGWGVWLALALAVLLAVLLHLTVLGRHIFALGSNEATARLCGINVPRTKTLVYTLGGLFVGIAGIYQFARLSTGNPTGGLGMELKIIAAVVIGGGSLSGGRGSVIGTLTGAAIMLVISSGCTALELRNPIQDIIIGAIIVAAVALDQIRQRRF